MTLAYLDNIEKIKSQSIDKGFYRNKPIYRIVSDIYGDIYVNIWEENGKVFDNLQFKIKNDTSFWMVTSAKEFYENYISDNNLKVIEYLLRVYGEPKLKKPKELKNTKQVFSVDYIRDKCRCPIFFEGNNVWIQHRDYFSSIMELPTDEVGAPLGYLANKYCNKQKKNKFIYGDAWGSIVLRNECWLKLEKLLYRIKLGESII
jgi:hypothetical protein